MKNILLLLVSLLLFSCASQPTSGPDRTSLLREFRNSLHSESEIWAPATPASVRQAVSRFQKREKLKNGRVYGESVRKLDLVGKSAAEVAAQLAPFSCQRTESVIHKPQGGEMLCQGKTIPQIIFSCPDGGLIRLKIAGDPCSPRRPQAHGVKSVRDPFDGDPEKFSDEAFKVDSDGQAIPKLPSHLAPGLNPDGWAEDAHADLKQ